MEQIVELESEARSAVEAAATTAELRELELKYLGKRGELTGLMRSIGSLSKEERPKFGAAVNEATARLQSLIDSRVAELKSGELASQFDAERIDVTMPSRTPQAGLEHVLQQATNRIMPAMSPAQGTIA